jgi:DNA topoisomerase-2
MVLFTPTNKLKRYQTTMDIMEEFFHLRLSYYGKRKSYLLSKLNREVDLLDNKVKFIRGVMADEIQIKGRKKKELVESLLKYDLKPIKKMTQIESTKLKSFKEENKENKEDEDEEEGESNTINPS